MFWDLGGAVDFAGGIGFDFLFGCFFFNRAVFSVEKTNVFLHVDSFGLPVNI